VAALEAKTKHSQWTAEEDALIQTKRTLMSRKELALKVGRTPAAVSSRLQVLDGRLDAPLNGNGIARDEAEDPALPRPLAGARRQLETAILATAQVLQEGGAVETWHRGDVFHALYLMLDARDRLTSLEGCDGD
jgi:hypothetical protein